MGRGAKRGVWLPHHALGLNRNALRVGNGLGQTPTKRLAKRQSLS
jgi:hypothetical protein